MKVKLGEIRAVGINSYMDDQNRNIIADKKNRIAYVVEKDDEKHYLIYSNRYILGLVTLILLSMMINKWVGIAAAVIITGYLEISYRKDFLKKLISINNVDFPKRMTTTENMIQQNDSVKCIMLAVMCVAIVIFSAIYLYQAYPGFRFEFTDKTLEEKLLVVMLPALSIFAVYLCICGIKAYKEIKKKRAE